MLQLHRSMQSAGFRSCWRGNSNRARRLHRQGMLFCRTVWLQSYEWTWLAAHTTTGSFSKFAHVFKKSPSEKRNQANISHYSFIAQSILLIINNTIQTIHRFTPEATPKPIISFLVIIQQKRTSASDILV